MLINCLDLVAGIKARGGAQGPSSMTLGQERGEGQKLQELLQELLQARSC